jgi:hypothetical protein
MPFYPQARAVVHAGVKCGDGLLPVGPGIVFQGVLPLEKPSGASSAHEARVNSRTWR